MRILGKCFGMGTGCAKALGWTVRGGAVKKNEREGVEER